ncbi:recombination-associated protein RdgC [Sulfurisoma sediminicola]|nr:recombination-associated protein RdgC [Sulfurisoma sediminicola]
MPAFSTPTIAAAMWFRNLRLYRLSPAWDMDAPRLNALLADHPLARCGSQDMVSRGWVYPRYEGEFVHAVNRCWLIALGVEQKLLPAAVVREATNERAATIEAEQGRKVGRKEMRDLREHVTQELLPRAFTRRRTTWGWLDPVSGWLVLDAGSDSKAEEFIEALLKCAPGMPLRPLQTQVSPGTAMTEWLAAGEGPAGFGIDDELELRPPTPANAAIRYVHLGLEGEEIRAHIAAGKTATKLGLTWSDRVSFVLTDKLQVKRLGFLDIIREQAADAQNADEQFDIDFTLMSGEVARLLGDLVPALGGEAQSD